MKKIICMLVFPLSLYAQRIHKEKFWAPDFLIIGEAKCGTTSLYNYLVQHPQILPASTKEIKFFDQKYEKKDLYWYRNQFPHKTAPNQLIGEASTLYFFHPLTPKRIFTHCPKTKIIVLLRDPVERAFSHYSMAARYGREKSDFDSALVREEKELPIHLQKMLSGEKYDIRVFFKAYCRRGTYIDSIKRWANFFAREQMLFIIAEEFFADPAITLTKVYKFLGLPNYQLHKYPAYNVANEKPLMNPDTEEKLYQFYAPYNTQLEQYLGIKLPWNIHTKKTYKRMRR